jgi:hypothetical protein
MDNENLANNLSFFWYEPGIIRVPAETHSSNRVGSQWIKNFSLKRFSITANNLSIYNEKVIISLFFRKVIISLFSKLWIKLTS